MCIVKLSLQTKLSCCESLCFYIFFFNFFFHFKFFISIICVYERFKVWFTLSICCQVAKAHIALLFLYSFTASKKTQMALKETENLEE